MGMEPDASSVTGNASDTDASLSGEEGRGRTAWKRSRMTHGAGDSINVVEGKVGSKVNMVAELQWNEESREMDVTEKLELDREAVPPPPLPQVTEEPVWANYIESQSKEQARAPTPGTPVLLTAAKLLRDSSVLFDVNSERAFAVRFEALTDDVEQNGQSSKVTLEDMQSLLPHPEALFLPASMEWKIISSEPNFKVQSEATPIDFRQVPLYHVQPLMVVSPSEQRHPVVKAGASMPLDKEDFLDHFAVISSRTRRFYVSQPNAVPSIVNEELFLKLRSTRLENPPPGVTDTAQYFDGAVRLILRMIGNALGGNPSAVVTGSKVINSKLGWDAVSLAIFEHLGWKVTRVSEDDPRDAIRPPKLIEDGVIQPGWRRMGRAWVELHLWAQHCRSKMGIKDTGAQQHPAGVPFTVSGVDALSLLDQQFGLDTRQLIPDTRPSDRSKVSYNTLGVYHLDSDETIKEAYVSAVERHPELATPLLSAIEQIHNEERKGSVDLPILLADERSKGYWTTDELEKAMAVIGLEGVSSDLNAQVEDAFLLSLVEGKLNAARDNIGEEKEMEILKRHMQVICHSRGDPPELCRLVEAFSGMSPAQAYSRLQIPEPAEAIDDESLLMLYQVRVNDAPARADEWRQALHTIAKARNSEFLLRQTQGGGDGDDPWSVAPDPNKPAGLNNIGNTCYLNSVLQYFFSLREIRDRVLQYSQAEPSKTLRRVGGRQVTQREAERSHQFILQLAGLFQNMISFPAPAVTPERDLAYLALVSPELEGVRPPSNSESNASGETDVTLVDAPPPEQRASLMQVGAQQDVSECLDNVMFQLEVALSPPDSTEGDLLSSLFVGETAQRLHALTDEEKEVEVKKEVFKILLVDVVDLDGQDIYDGLDSFFDEEVIESGDKSIRRSVTLARPPPILQVQLQRVQFDRQRGRAYKSQAHMETYQTIFLDRYCEDGDRIEKRKRWQELRREAMRLRPQAALLRGAKTLPVTADLVDSLQTDLPNVVEDGLGAELRACAAQAERELTEIEERLLAIKKETMELWQDETRHEYVLVSLFMHRGEATHGHYFLNQRRDTENAWFKYNDSVVSNADVKDVLRDPTTANPYLVCYVRRDLQDKLALVQTLSRRL